MKNPEELFRGVLEGIGWDFDNSGEKDAQKIKDHISKHYISKTRVREAVIHHPRKGLGEQYTMGWNNAKDYVKRKLL